MRFPTSEEAPEDVEPHQRSEGVGGDRTRRDVEVRSRTLEHTRRLVTDGGEDEGETEESDEDEETDDEETDDEESAAQTDEGDGPEEAEDTDEDTDEDEEEQEAEDEEEGEEDEERARVLHLDLQGLFLDLLGLEVDLDEVVLDVDAVEGENNLLGNLLSAVAGLLNPMSGGGLGSLLGGMPGLGRLFGGSGEGDGDGEDGEGGGASGFLSSAKESLSASAGEAMEDVDLDDLLTQLLKEFLTQLLGDGSEESADESGS